ncbi:uncharacterized protein LOC105650750 isoform X2 [Jatropha curcas]|uniref:uncharacterized protein LOC105650750 isoform X2 n=1 Tax=Jatropha curcas TaxID=180498 RepID=UPI0005FAC117|nr:uncharacterized protein LOC105650750 isoform X2 [Jatropha curcas]
MAMGGIARTKMIILSSLPVAVPQYDYDYDCKNHDHQLEKSSRNSIKEGKRDSAPYWIPHPRTGIYVPKGQEWMMDDVPEGAASFNQTYWLRNVDVVDRPDPDIFSNH